MKTFECLDTTESRILFGFLRKVYNFTIMSKNINIPLCDSIISNVKNTAKFAKLTSERNKTEVRLSKKKRGNLPSLNKDKSTIIVKDGKIKFKTKKSQFSYELILKNVSDLKDGVYTEAFISWVNKTPMISINENRARFQKPGISEKNIKKLLKNKLKSEQKIFSSKKSALIRKARNIEKIYGTSSNEFIIALNNVNKSITEVKGKIKFNLYYYIEEMNKKYSSLKIKESLFVGENQANTNLKILSLKKNTEKSIYDLFYSDMCSAEDNNFLIDILDSSFKIEFDINF
jgi:hypothetical protein